AHQDERKWFLRVQIIRELTMGARQTIGLEPLGRLKIEYHGLHTELATIQRWAARLSCDAEALVHGVESLLDTSRSRKMLFDEPTRIYSQFWLGGAREIQRGYLPNMTGVPNGLVFERESQHDKGRIKQWFSTHGSVAMQAARAWGAESTDVAEF